MKIITRQLKKNSWTFVSSELDYTTYRRNGFIFKCAFHRGGVSVVYQDEREWYYQPQNCFNWNRPTFKERRLTHLETRDEILNVIRNKTWL